MTKNHQKIRSRCLIDEFSFADIFNDINHGHRAAILKKKFLWLLPFYMGVATYFYYEKVRRTMRTAIVSYLLKQKTLKQKSIFCPSILCQRNSIESTPIFCPLNLQQKCISKKTWNLIIFGLSHIHAMSNKSGYWAVAFPTTYFTTSIKSELTRKIFFVPHAILLYNSTSGIAALLQNSKYFACCLTQKICWTQGRGDLTLHITALLDIWQNIFIKFSKQIANSFSKIINGYKGEFKTLPNISDEAFSASYYWLWSQTRNLATKHLRWSFFQK